MSEISDVSIGVYLQQIPSQRKDAMHFANVLTEAVHQKNAQQYDRLKTESPIDVEELVYVREFARKAGATAKPQNQYKGPYRMTYKDPTGVTLKVFFAQTWFKTISCSWVATRKVYTV